MSEDHPSEELVAGIVLPSIKIKRGTIANLAWPALLDAPETLELHKWVGARFGGKFVTGEEVWDHLVEIREPAEQVCTRIAMIPLADARHILTAAGLDFESEPEDMQFSEKLLLISVSYLRRDDFVAVTTAGCDPGGVRRVLTGLSAIIGGRRALHVSFPPLVDEAPLRSLTAQTFVGRPKRRALGERLSRLIGLPALGKKRRPR